MAKDVERALATSSRAWRASTNEAVAFVAELKKARPLPDGRVLSAMNAPAHPAAVRTACPYCGVGCGVLARPDGRAARPSRRPDHPANFGLLCSKGLALDETLGLDGRLLHPMLRAADGRLARVDWDTALDVADGFRRVVERTGRTRSRSISPGSC